MIGMGYRNEPSITSRSVWQSPAAFTRTSTSALPSAAAMTRSIASGARAACSTAASYCRFMAAVTNRNLPSRSILLFQIAFLYPGFGENPHRGNHEHRGHHEKGRKLRPHGRAAPIGENRRHDQGERGDGELDVVRHQYEPTGTAAASSGRRGAPRSFFFRNLVSYPF